MLWPILRAEPGKASAWPLNPEDPAEDVDQTGKRSPLESERPRKELGKINRRVHDKKCIIYSLYLP